MDKPHDNGGGGGCEVGRVSVPHLTIAFDPRTCLVQVGGSTPTTYFAKVMLIMALDGIELKLQAERMPQIALAGGPLPGVRA